MHGYTSSKIDVLSCSLNGSSFHIDIAFGKKEFAYAFVLQINCTCIFFVLLRLRGHTLLSMQWWIREFKVTIILSSGKGMIVSGTIFLWKGTVGPQYLIGSRSPYSKVLCIKPIKMISMYPITLIPKHWVMKPSSVCIPTTIHWPEY